MNDKERREIPHNYCICLSLTLAASRIEHKGYGSNRADPLLGTRRPGTTLVHAGLILLLNFRVLTFRLHETDQKIEGTQPKINIYQPYQPSQPVVRARVSLGLSLLDILGLPLQPYRPTVRARWTGTNKLTLK